MAALLLCAVLVVLSILYADRPVAEYLNRRVYGTAVADTAEWILNPLPWGLGAMAAVALYAALLALARKPIGPRLAALLPCSLAALAAVTIAEALKLLIGRSDAYPSYLVGGEYGVRPLHGAPGFSSFPSATTAGTCAAVAACWAGLGRWRSAVIVIMLAVPLAIILVIGHWVSDVLAGAWLGGFTGWEVTRRLRSRRAAVPRG